MLPLVAPSIILLKSLFNVLESCACKNNLFTPSILPIVLGDFFKVLAIIFGSDIIPINTLPVDLTLPLLKRRDPLKEASNSGTPKLLMSLPI